MFLTTNNKKLMQLSSKTEAPLPSGANNLKELMSKSITGKPLNSKTLL
jgi:hypothetical protein